MQAVPEASQVRVPVEAWPRRGDWKGRVTRLLKKDGELVEEGDELAEVEIEKAVLVIEAPQKGVVRYLVEEGSPVDPDTVIAEILPPPGEEGG